MDKNTKKEQDEAFEYRLKEVSNDEIISILQYREHFQHDAVNAAIKEAIHRGIINTLDDLDKTEFRPILQKGKTLFPLASTDAFTFGIFKSLCRVSYIYGLIPLVFAVFQFIKNEYIIGTAALIIGISLILLVHKLEKTLQIIYANLLLLINIPVIVISAYSLYSFSSYSAMDVFAMTCIVFITLYVTFYVRKLSRFFSSKR